MKKIFTFIAVLFSITTFAAPGPKTSKITISNNDRSKMQVNIDGRMYDVNSTFVMDNIRSGNHSITINRTEKLGFRTVNRVIYNNSMYVTSGQMIDVDINRSGKVVVKTSSNDKFGRDERNNRNDRDYNDRYDNRNDKNNRNNNGRDNNYGRY
ncbi:MAG TPA: hypothetical protein VM187_19280 [Niastella sp.]|nr:hypothetical protein [Niastella sp.]